MINYTRIITLLATQVFMVLFTYGQGNQLEVGLRNGDILYPESLRVKNPLFKSEHLLVNDSLEFFLPMVDYYQTTGGYFIVRSFGRYSYKSLERVEEGKLSVYTYISTSYSAPMMGPNGSMMGGGNMVSKREFYYEKEHGPLRHLSIYNLKSDLSGDPLAMEKLNEITKLRWLRIGLWGLGGALAIVGLNQMTREYNDAGPPYDDVSLKPNAPLVIGSIMILAPFTFMPKKQDKMMEAVRIYNR